MYCQGWRQPPGASTPFSHRRASPRFGGWEEDLKSILQYVRFVRSSRQKPNWAQAVRMTRAVGAGWSLRNSLSLRGGADLDRLTNVLGLTVDTWPLPNVDEVKIGTSIALASRLSRPWRAGRSLTPSGTTYCTLAIMSGYASIPAYLCVTSEGGPAGSEQQEGNAHFC